MSGLNQATILEREIENLTTAIEKMADAIENSKLDLEATKVIKESLESQLKQIIVQTEIEI
tara:strand:+ start:391 stop:573 length:183 start_codon:yes stop_codon:yes gene_type:complete